MNHKSSMFVTIVCNHPRGHVCKIWRECAKKAFEDECDFMVLMGDGVDVGLKDEGWMRAAYTEFEQLAVSSGTNLGCIALQDISFPGMPTFHRAHMEILKEKVVPDIFINQDALVVQRCSRVEFQMRSVVRPKRDTPSNPPKTPSRRLTLPVESWIREKGCKLLNTGRRDTILPCRYIRVMELESSKAS